MDVFFRVMVLSSLPVEFVEDISQTVHDVIKICVDPEGKVSSGPATRYFFVRALARDAELEDNILMPPKHAYALLQWLMTTFTHKVFTNPQQGTLTAV